VKDILERIKHQVIEQKYDITNHALAEAADDGFDIFDVEKALLTGKIVKKYTKDSRGTRYKIIGKACDHIRHVVIIGRFRGDQLFRIITVYEAKKQRKI